MRLGVAERALPIPYPGIHLLRGARRRGPDTRTGLIITGLISSLAAVCVHNFFIYDQIPTGMYFFALMALAIAAAFGACKKSSAAAFSRTSLRENLFWRTGWPRRARAPEWRRQFLWECVPSPFG